MTISPLSTPADLTNCDREPIHIPGRVQPHGILFALAEPDLSIIQVSDNSLRQIGSAPESLLGQPLDTLLPGEYVDYLRQTLATEDVEQNPLYVWTVPLEGAQQPLDGLIHRHNGVLILELEPAQASKTPAPDFYRRVRTTIARLQSALRFTEFCDAAAGEVRALTGFDRVMIYKFDADGHGSVIAEAKADRLTPYLGLHYPASDIPQQARALYLRSWLRLIPDVRYAPADIVPVLTPGAGVPLDLSYSVLRSVSPLHIEYLNNMGVAASMSISLVKDGALWGLIACHHYAPKYIPYEIRSACEFLGQAISLQLIAKEDADDYEYRVQIKEIGTQLVQQMALADPWRDALVTNPPTMLDLIDATGAALCLEEQIDTLGATPAVADIHTLLEWLSAQPTANIYAITSLATDCPDLAHCKDLASGVLAAPISREQDEYLLWFRPEVIQTVSWGGEPSKAVEIGEDGMRLSPRKSFDLWRQTVALHALPWKPAEMAAAAELCSAIQGVVLRRAAALARLNAELERSNVELDAFAYIASHDLKEPLRGLHNYANFLLEDYGKQLDAEGQAKLQTMIRLTQRMETLLESLLHYSRVGRIDLAVQEIDTHTLVRDVLDRLAVTLEHEQVDVRIPTQLPTLRCDRVRLAEVFYNLITNAIKYNTGTEKWIEIGWHDGGVQHGAAQPEQRLYTFYVRDNGIGIHQKHFDTIFRIFKRLHGRDQFGGGAGAGLTIAKKIVERHGGTIWLESAPGAGTTFFFTVKG